MHPSVLPFFASAAAFASAVAGVAIPIHVGVKGALTFSPESVTAKVGDTLEFHFFTGSGAHSVVAGAFDKPCNPSSNGFFSGYVPGDSAGDTTFIVPVNSTDPIYFYCSLNRHCQEGMVGAVNPASGQTLDAYKTAAKGATKGAPAALQGGVLTSFGTMAPAGPTSAVGGSGSSSASTTSAVHTSTTSSSSSGSTTGSATGTAATAKPTNAVGGRKDELSVVLGLTIIVGALVALMS